MIDKDKPTFNESTIDSKRPHYFFFLIKYYL